MRRYSTLALSNGTAMTMSPTPLPLIRAERGAAATPHYLATQAAMGALMEGGNAIDAAVTANAVLGVVELAACGLGGDLLMLYRDGKTGEITALNGSGRAGAAMTTAAYRARGLEEMPTRGPLPVTVPGTVDAWDVALKRHGTWDLARALAPAIRYASEGFPVGRFLSSNIARSIPDMSSDAQARYLDGGRAPAVGDRLRLPDLAASMRLIAEGGRDVFYRGELAGRIASSVQAAGGLLTAEDFEAHVPADWVTPLRGHYRGLEVLEAPPNSHGMAALLMTQILEGYDFAPDGSQAARELHLMVEAKHQAFAERDRWVADPAFMREPAPLARLLSAEWAAEARARIDETRAGVAVSPGGHGDTVFLTVMDRDGNAVAITQSLYWIFGSGLVAGDTGILLHNRGAGFNLDESHLNALAAGKRPFHTLAPAMALRDGKFALAFGTRGAHGQPQTHVQLLNRIVDQRMGLAEALAAPRWISGSVDGRDAHTLRVESRFGSETIDALARMGHRVEVGDAWDHAVGHTNAIALDGAGGFFTAATDPRADGAAAGW